MAVVGNKLRRAPSDGSLRCGSTVQIVIYINAASKDAPLAFPEMDLPRDEDDIRVACMIDNTVNRVIESFRSITEDFGTDDLETLSEEDQESDTDEDEPTSGVVESAILSAINHHGLQPPGGGQEESDRPYIVSPTSEPDLDVLGDVAISAAIQHQGFLSAMNDHGLQTPASGVQEERDRPDILNYTLSQSSDPGHDVAI